MTDTEDLQLDAAGCKVRSMVEGSFWSSFSLAMLATWRVTHLLAAEDGPGDVIARFRAWLGQTRVGRLMDCFNCLSLWVAAPAALFVSRSPLEWLFTWLALSGAACLLERATQQPVVIESMPQELQGDKDHGMLRSESSFGAPANGDSHAP